MNRFWQGGNFVPLSFFVSLSKNRTMLQLIVWYVVIACVCAFLLNLARKWGMIEYWQVHTHSDFIYKLLSCHFCTSFWACVIGGAIAACFVGWPLLFTPLVATVICQKLW